MHRGRIDAPAAPARRGTRALQRDTVSTAIDIGRWHFVQRPSGTGDQAARLLPSGAPPLESVRFRRTVPLGMKCSPAKTSRSGVSRRANKLSTWGGGTSGCVRCSGAVARTARAPIPLNRSLPLNATGASACNRRRMPAPRCRWVRTTDKLPRRRQRCAAGHSRRFRSPRHT